MLNFIVTLFSKLFGKAYKKFKLKVNKKYPIFNRMSLNNYSFKNYRKTFKFTPNQLTIYFASLLVSGLSIVILFLIDKTILKNYNIYIVLSAIFILLVYEIYPKIVNIRKRNLLIKRKDRLLDKINKIFILEVNMDTKKIAFDFGETVELKKNNYISWKHELKLLAIEKNYNIIFNIIDGGDGYVRANFGNKRKSNTK